MYYMVTLNEISEGFHIGILYIIIIALPFYLYSVTRLKSNLRNYCLMLLWRAVQKRERTRKNIDYATLVAKPGKVSY